MQNPAVSHLIRYFCITAVAVATAASLPAQSASPSSAPTTTNAQAQANPAAATPQNRLLDRWTAKLKLTADQQKQLAPMIKASEAKCRKVNEDKTLTSGQKKAALVPLKLELRQKALSVLTADQQKVLNSEIAGLSNAHSNSKGVANASKAAVTGKPGSLTQDERIDATIAKLSSNLTKGLSDQQKQQIKSILTGKIEGIKTVGLDKTLSPQAKEAKRLQMRTDITNGVSTVLDAGQRNEFQQMNFNLTPGKHFGTIKKTGGKAAKAAIANSAKPNKVPESQRIDATISKLSGNLTESLSDQQKQQIKSILTGNVRAIKKVGFDTTLAPAAKEAKRQQVRVDLMNNVSNVLDAGQKNEFQQMNFNLTPGKHFAAAKKTGGKAAKAAITNTAKSNNVPKDQRIDVTVSKLSDNLTESLSDQQKQQIKSILAGKVRAIKKIGLDQTLTPVAKEAKRQQMRTDLANSVSNVLDAGQKNEFQQMNFDLTPGKHFDTPKKMGRKAAKAAAMAKVAAATQ